MELPELHIGDGVTRARIGDGVTEVHIEDGVTRAHIGDGVTITTYDINMCLLAMFFRTLSCVFRLCSCDSLTCNIRRPL